MPRYYATLEACTLRLRPIIMTSFAHPGRELPLVLSQGQAAKCGERGAAVFAEC